MPLKTEEIEGVEIHIMNDSDTLVLIGYFAKNIPETIVRKIAVLIPFAQFSEIPPSLTVPPKST